MRLPSLGSIWRRRKREADPYAEFYLHSKAADPRNLIVNRIREAPEGSVFGVKADTHTPEVMSEHIKELGRFFGADLVHIASTKGLALGPEREAEALPFAIVCGFRSQHDPRDAFGIGGQAAALKGAFATFQISAIVREFGFNATRANELDAENVAVSAGIGALNQAGRIEIPGFGSSIHIADLILTDLPLEPDR